jgi:cytochrome b561
MKVSPSKFYFSLTNMKLSSSLWSRRAAANPAIHGGNTPLSRAAVKHGYIAIKLRLRSGAGGQRMQLTNTKTAFGWVAIALHWISVVGVFWLFFSGDEAGEATTSEAKIPLMQYHISLGACFFLFLASRVIWSFTQPKPVSLSPSKLDIVAKAVQHLFLAMIAILIISGPLAVWSNAYPIQVFDWFAIPSPFSVKNEGLHELAGTIHSTVRKAFWPLLVLHLLGVGKSLVINKDRTLQRMLWVKKDV